MKQILPHSLQRYRPFGYLDSGLLATRTVRQFLLFEPHTSRGSPWKRTRLLQKLLLQELACGHVRAQSCLTLYGPVGAKPPGSSVHEIPQARVLACTAVSSSRASSQPWVWTCVSGVSCMGRWILYYVPCGDPPLEGQAFGKPCKVSHPVCSGHELSGPELDFFHHFLIPSQDSSWQLLWRSLVWVVALLVGHQKGGWSQYTFPLSVFTHPLGDFYI